MIFARWLYPAAPSLVYGEQGFGINLIGCVYTSNLKLGAKDLASQTQYFTLQNVSRPTPSLAVGWDMSTIPEESQVQPDCSQQVDRLHTLSLALGADQEQTFLGHLVSVRLDNMPFAHQSMMCLLRQHVFLNFVNLAEIMNARPCNPGLFQISDSV